jgi:thiol:disulfide interchange protein DsbD
MRLALLVRLLSLLPLAPGFLQGSARAQELSDRQPVRASLLADVEPAAAGEEFQIGVLLEMAPGWHVYWTYPGNTGKPTSVAFRADERLVKVLEPRFPAPRVYPGQTIEELSFGYHDTLLVAADAFVHEPPEGGSLELQAEVTWLACKQACVTGRATPRLKLAVAEVSRPSAAAPRFRAAKAEHPAPLAEEEGFLRSLEHRPGRLVLRFALPALSRAEGFAPRWSTGGACKLVDHGVRPASDGRGFEAQVVLEGPACLPQAGGVVWGARTADEPLGPLELKAHTRAAAEPRGPTAAPAGGQEDSPAAREPVWLLLLFALLGGLILNVMPCVIPVVIPKLLHVVRTAQKSSQPSERRRLLWTNSLAYTAGVLSTMAALGALVVILKAVGHEVGWGFQFQNPWFLVFMISLLLVLGLGMLRVFSLKSPSHVEDLKGLRSVRRARPVLESFLTGLLVTFLGTPCTAPFLGPALGYAFTADSLVVMTFLLTVGLGLAAPFLLLGAWTGWTRILPTRVTERYDRVMRGLAFLLFATAVWLLGVLGEAYGTGAAQATTWFALCLTGLAWLYGLVTDAAMPWRRRLVRLLPLAALAALAGFWLLDLDPGGAPGAPRAVEAGPIRWEPFSEARVAELRREGKTVFIDFTAGWCMNCKANERLVLETEATRALVERLGVAMLKADYTRPDPVIHRWLKRHGRAGVPMYLVFPACAGDERVELLPELLTSGLLHTALETAGPSRPGCP